MPSQRKRIGYLPSEEVHKIIDQLCKDNEFSQSKVTGLLVEEALRSRGILTKNFSLKQYDNQSFMNYSFKQVESYKNNQSTEICDEFTVNKKSFSEDIKMIHQFIEFKYFKKVMMQNNNIF